MRNRSLLDGTGPNPEWIVERLRRIADVGIFGVKLEPVHLGLAVLILVASMPLWVRDQVVLRVVVYVGIYGILTLSLNVVTGWTGQFSMASAAFYGVGAYTAAIISTRTALPWWIGMLGAGLLAAIAGAIIGLPTLRLRGPYLALATIGFTESFRILVINAGDLTNGPYGIGGIPRPEIAGFKIASNAAFLYLALVVLVIFVVSTRRLVNSRIGRAWVSIREDEYAAEQIGINATFYKVVAFVYGAFFSGVAGSIFAYYITYIAPDNFMVIESVIVMAMMVLGGMASIPGSLAGPVVLLGIERGFAFLYNYRIILYGTVLALCVILRPQGLLGSRSAVLRAEARRRPKEKQMGTLLARAGEETGQREETRPRLSTIPRPSAADLEKSEKVLEVKGLSKSFGGLVAVDNLEFCVRKGEILSIIGPNGSGKTTVFNLVMGALAPDAGQVLLEGKDLARLPPFERVRRGLGRTFQEIRLFFNMTVEDNLMVAQHARLKTGMAGSLLRGPGAVQEETRAHERAKEILGMFYDRLLPRANDFSITLSYANRRRCEIARALATDPKLLMLDEPCAGMNPSERAEMSEIIAELRHRGYTILLIEHHMGLVMEISDRVIVLDHGRCVCEGKPELVKTDKQVVAAYLGPEPEG